VVESTVTKKEVEEDLGQVRFRQVAVQLAIKVQPVLPAGALRRDLEMQQVLRLMAESFGIPVSCHPEQPAVALYTGAWDGRGCRIEPESLSPDQPVLILGTFWPDGRGCENVWVFHQAKYLEWYRARVWGGHAAP
jgi:hypothetical protein